MAVPFHALRIKHQYSLSNPDLKTILEQKQYITNGYYYLLHIEDTFHYDALVNGFERYAKYLITVNDIASHSVENYTTLIETFSLEKLTPIEVNLYEHSPFFWVQDGNHRLAILKYKQYFGDKLPLQYLNVNVYEKVQNILKDALRKTVGKVHYNGWNNRLEFGYHSFHIYNFDVQGQRNPIQRLEKMKQHISFEGKTVLDLGCNTGGMLFHIPEIKQGIGLDFDQTCIDSCNCFKDRLNFACDLNFHQADLNTLNLQDFCTQNTYTPDIVFLLSLGSWVKNWRKLYEDVLGITSTILLETNNDTEGKPQLDFFRSKGATIQCISDCSDDDCTGNHGRKTYLITKASRPPLRFLQYPDDCHPKNKEAIQRMCKTLQMSYEATNDKERLQRADYDLLWLPMRWISPDELPPTVKILYGPHHFIFPEGALVGPRNPEWSAKAIYTTLSHWNQSVFAEFAPETVIPCLPLPFGINPQLEDCRSHPKTLDCLVYVKRRDPKHLETVKALLDHKGLSYKVFSYGSYTNQDYLNALKQVKFAIWIGSHESQGYAFQECLASNVPILLWDVLSMKDEYGSYQQYTTKNLFATTATQWSSECGERIIREYELEPALESIQASLERYTPRRFILSRVADAVAMKGILGALGLN